MKSLVFKKIKNGLIAFVTLLLVFGLFSNRINLLEDDENLNDQSLINDEVVTKIEIAVPSDIDLVYNGTLQNAPLPVGFDANVLEVNYNGKESGTDVVEFNGGFSRISLTIKEEFQESYKFLGTDDFTVSYNWRIVPLRPTIILADSGLTYFENFTFKPEVSSLLGEEILGNFSLSINGVALVNQNNAFNYTPRVGGNLRAVTSFLSTDPNYESVTLENDVRVLPKSLDDVISIEASIPFANFISGEPIRVGERVRVLTDIVLHPSQQAPTGTVQFKLSGANPDGSDLIFGTSRDFIPTRNSSTRTTYRFTFDYFTDRVLDNVELIATYIPDSEASSFYAESTSIIDSDYILEVKPLLLPELNAEDINIDFDGQDINFEYLENGRAVLDNYYSLDLDFEVNGLETIVTYNILPVEGISELVEGLNYSRRVIVTNADSTIEVERVNSDGSPFVDGNAVITYGTPIYLKVSAKGLNDVLVAGEFSFINNQEVVSLTKVGDLYQLILEPGEVDLRAGFTPNQETLYNSSSLNLDLDLRVEASRPTVTLIIDQESDLTYGDVIKFSVLTADINDQLVLGSYDIYQRLGETEVKINQNVSLDVNDSFNFDEENEAYQAGEASYFVRFTPSNNLRYLTSDSNEVDLRIDKKELEINLNLVDFNGNDIDTSEVFLFEDLFLEVETDLELNDDLVNELTFNDINNQELDFVKVEETSLIFRFTPVSVGELQVRTNLVENEEFESVSSEFVNLNVVAREILSPPVVIPSVGGGTSSNLNPPIRRHLLRFDTNGGELIEPVSVTRNNIYNINQIPTRAGYTFDGWFENSDFSGEALNSTSLTANKTIYAKWLLNEVIVDEVPEIEILEEEFLELPLAEEGGIVESIRPEFGFVDDTLANLVLFLGLTSFIFIIFFKLRKKASK